MSTGILKAASTKHLLFGIIVITIFLTFYIVDYALLGTEVIYHFKPNASPGGLARTFILAVLAGGLVLYVAREDPKPEGNPGPGYYPVDLRPLKTLAVPAALLPWAALSLALFTVSVFAYDRNLFYELGREDKIVELLSALFAFLAGIYFVILFFMTRGEAGGIRKAVFLAFGFIFLLISLEEVSWFQRAFWLPAPELLRGNLQEEINLHNFATNEIENIYYFSSFIFLILLPFIHDRTQFLSRFETLSFFIPSVNVLLFSALMAALTFDMWNQSPTQFAFFATLFILIDYLLQAYRNPEQPLHLKIFLPAVIGVYLVTQFAFFALGETSVRHWDVTEYKELFIPLGFFFYALEISRKAIKIIPFTFILVTGLITLGFAILRLIQKYTM